MQKHLNKRRITITTKTTRFQFKAFVLNTTWQCRHNKQTAAMCSNYLDLNKEKGEIWIMKTQFQSKISNL